MTEVSEPPPNRPIAQSPNRPIAQSPNRPIAQSPNRPMPNAQCPMPNAQCPMPSPQFQIPSPGATSPPPCPPPTPGPSTLNSQPSRPTPPPAATPPNISSNSAAISTPSLAPASLRLASPRPGTANSPSATASGAGRLPRTPRLPLSRSDEVDPDSPPSGRHVSDDWLFHKLREPSATHRTDLTLADFCRILQRQQHHDRQTLQRLARIPPPAPGSLLNRRTTTSSSEYPRRTHRPTPRHRRPPRLQTHPQRVSQTRHIACGTFYRHFNSWTQARDYADLTPHARRPQLKSDEFCSTTSTASPPRSGGTDPRRIPLPRKRRSRHAP